MAAIGHTLVNAKMCSRGRADTDAFALHTDERPLFVIRRQGIRVERLTAGAGSQNFLCAPTADRRAVARGRRRNRPRSNV
jgi:hypothetical protein